MAHNITYLYISTLILLCLNSCFTGIESTPRITSSDVKKEHIELTPEQQFMQHISAEPMSTWRPGKQFYVTDSKIALIFTSDQPIDTAALFGSILTFNDTRKGKTLTGDEVAVIDLKTSTGQTLSYRTEIPYSEIETRKQTEIPFAVDMALVDTVRNEIKDKQYYITNPLWYDENGTATVNGLRHVAVNIEDVLPGNSVFPVRVVFKPVDGDKLYSVYMSLSSGLTSTRNFDTLFAFSNPRKQYPRITDETWQLIIHSKVKIGMTRDECRLALGSPKVSGQRPTTAGMIEYWQYPDGVYLLFEDGLLAAEGPGQLPK